MLFKHNYFVLFVISFFYHKGHKGFHKDHKITCFLQVATWISMQKKAFNLTRMKAFFGKLFF
jgi:hypothetical protein